MQRDGGLCQPCVKAGLVTQGTEVDHVINLESGGTDDLDNLQTICAPCHQAKTVAEALAARGLAAPRVSQACAADGMPTDPRHPWAQGRGVQMSGALPADTDPCPSLATCRNGQGGLSGGR